MKKTIKILLALLVLIGMMGCEQPTQPALPKENDFSTTPQMISVTIENLCSSKVKTKETNGNSRVFTEVKNGIVQTLTYFDGKLNKPYIFNIDGVNCLLGINEVTKIADKVIAIKYDSIHKLYADSDFDKGIYHIKEDKHQYYRQGIVNLENGNLIPISNLNINKMKCTQYKAYAYGKPPFSDNLYEINLNNKQSVDIKSFYTGKSFVCDNYYILKNGDILYIQLDKLKGQPYIGNIIKFTNNGKFVLDNIILGGKSLDYNDIYGVIENSQGTLYLIYHSSNQEKITESGSTSTITNNFINLGTITEKLEGKKFTWNVEQKYQEKFEEYFDFYDSISYQKEYNSNRYIQAPTKYFRTDKLKIIEKKVSNNNKKILELKIDVSPSLQTEDSPIKVSEYTNVKNWKDARAYTSGKEVDNIFVDNKEMLGDDIYWEKDGKIYKNNSENPLNSAYPMNIDDNSDSKHFNLVKIGKGENDYIIIFDSGSKTYSMSLNGSDIKPFSDIDIGMNNVMNFNGITITQPKFTNNNNLTGEEVFENLSGLNKFWKAVYKADKTIPQPMPTFRITDLDKNMMTLHLKYLDEEAELLKQYHINELLFMPESVGHYDVIKGEGDKDILRLLVGEDCLPFDLTICGKVRLSNPKNQNVGTEEIVQNDVNGKDIYLKMELRFMEFATTYYMQPIGNPNFPDEEKSEDVKNLEISGYLKK